MENFDLKKYLAEGRLLESLGFNLKDSKRQKLFADYARKLGYNDLEIKDDWFVGVNGLKVYSDDRIKLDQYQDKLLDLDNSGSLFKDEKPSDTITLAVDKAYYDDDKGEFTLTPTDVVVTADNFEDIIFDEVGDEEVDFTSYVRTYPKIFKRV